MAANVKNLPLSVIFAAKSGDGQALGAVLNHYQRYIRSLATRTLTDECGSKRLQRESGWLQCRLFWFP